MSARDTATTDLEDLAWWVTWVGLLASVAGMIAGTMVGMRDRPVLGFALAALAAGIGALVVLGNVAVRAALRLDRP